METYLLMHPKMEKLTKLTAHDSNGNPAYTRGRYDYPAGYIRAC